MASVNVIFFDIGGVLLTNGWGHLSRKKAAEHFGINLEETEVLHHYIFNIYEIGRISLDDYLDTVVFHTPRPFSREQFRDFMFSQSEELPDMLPWLKAWKKRAAVRLISLNTEGRELNDYRIRKFHLHECFDAFISSCDVGMRKPDPGIFRLALGIAQAKPFECLYFDDRPMLVEAAKKEGIHAYHHESFERTKKVIENSIG